MIAYESSYSYSFEISHLVLPSSRQLVSCIFQFHSTIGIEIWLSSWKYVEWISSIDFRRWSWQSPWDSFNHIFYPYLCNDMVLFKKKFFWWKNLCNNKVLVYFVFVNNDPKWYGYSVDHLNLHRNHDANVDHKYICLE